MNIGIHAALTVGIVLATASSISACGDKKSHKDRRGDPVMAADLDPSRAVVEDTPPAVASERREFAKMPVPTEVGVADWIPFLATHQDAERVVFANNAGIAWQYLEKTKTFEPLSLSLSAIWFARSFATNANTGWISTNEIFALVDASQTSDTFKIPALSIKLEDLAISKEADLVATAAYENALFMHSKDKLVLIQRGKDAGLISKTVTSPVKVEEILGAGLVKGLDLIWVVTAKELLVLEPVAESDSDLAWTHVNVELVPTDKAKILSLGGQVVQDKDQMTYKFAGPVYAVSDQGLLWSEKGQVVTDGLTTNKLNWSLNIRTLSEQFCVQCHAEFSTEDAWWSKKDEVARRLAVATKAEASAMPPPNTVPAKAISDEQRTMILTWLKAGPTPVGEAATNHNDGAGGEAGGDNSALLTTFNADIKPLATQYCQACHGAAAELSWWTNVDNAAAIKRELQASSMPQAGSAQANAITAPARAKMLQFVTP